MLDQQKEDRRRNSEVQPAHPFEDAKVGFDGR